MSGASGSLQQWGKAKEHLRIRSEYRLDSNTPQDIKNLFVEILNTGVHGFCFSLYSEGQQPGDIIGPEQIQRRLEILRPHCSWVRSFSCIEGNELIPKIAKEMGFKTLVGAWLSDDEAKNREEIDALIELANAGHVDIAAVGNEVLYRDDLPKERLLEYLAEVKSSVGDLAVGYVDAYYEFTRHPDLVEASDVILCNCYPYWEGCPQEYSLSHMKSMYHQAKAAAGGRPVLITETGWPSQGEPFEASIPSQDNAYRYFIDTQLWSQDEDIPVFYFSSFDESWKVSDEGEVGAYWGLWDKHEQLKM